MAERPTPADPPTSGSSAGDGEAAATKHGRGARRLGTTFTALSERDFAWFFVGNLAFFMATQMQFLTRGFLAFDLTDSAASLGYVTAAGAIPMLLLAPVGGVVADRLNKKRLLLVSQLVATAAAATAGTLVITGAIEFWHLLIIGMVSGTTFAFNMPARQSIVPQLVPRHKMMNAISLQMGGQNLTRVVAPALAGGLIGPVGVGWVYVLIAGLFLTPVISELRLPDHGMTTARKKSARAREDFAEALHYIRSDRQVAQLLILGLVFPLFAIPLYQILPAFAEDVFDAGPSGLGIMAASTGVGGVVGALISAALGRYERPGWLMFVSGVWLGVLYIGFSMVDVLAPAIVFLALGSIGGVVLQTTNNAVIQAAVPEEVRGRVLSVVMMSFGLMPLGVVPLSQAADAFGPQTAVAGSAVIMLVLLSALFLASASLRDLRLGSQREAELSPAQAAKLVAEGKITQERARELTRMDEGLGKAPTRPAASDAPSPGGSPGGASTGSG